MEQAERVALLTRCADLTAAAIALADRAGSTLSGALLEEALTAIRREAADRDRRSAG